MRNDFRDGPTSSGRPSRGDGTEVGQQPAAVLGALRKPETGVEDQRLAGDAGLDSSGHARTQLARHIGRPRRRSAPGGTCRSTARGCA